VNVYTSYRGRNWDKTYVDETAELWGFGYRNIDSKLHNVT